MPVTNVRSIQQASIATAFSFYLIPLWAFMRAWFDASITHLSLTNLPLRLASTGWRIRDCDGGEGKSRTRGSRRFLFYLNHKSWRWRCVECESEHPVRSVDRSLEKAEWER